MSLMMKKLIDGNSLSIYYQDVRGLSTKLTELYSKFKNSINYNLM